MKPVTNLVSQPVETDVFEGASFPEGMNPEAEDTLGGMGKLTGAAHYAAAIDPDGELSNVSVFQGQQFAGRFRGSVERCRRLDGEAFCHASFGKSGWKGLGICRGIPIQGNSQRANISYHIVDGEFELGERIDRINATGGQEDEPCGVGLAVFKQVDGAGEVVFHQLPGAGFTIHAGQYGRICGAIDYKIGRGQGIRIGLVADVSTIKLDLQVLFDQLAIQL